MSDDLHMCIDKPLPPELEALAQQLAKAENPANEPRPTSPFELAADWRYLWQPGATIRVRFLGGDSDIQAKVEHYAHQWEQFANMRFQFVATGHAHIRIAFLAGQGSWSYIGTQSLIYSDQQLPTMNYGWLKKTTPDDEYARVVLHEFGHALGCIHEHQHPEHGIPWDYEKAYAYYSRQGWTRERVDQQVFQRYNINHTRASQFDPESIMLYPIPAEVTTNNFSVGWNRTLSAQDKAFIEQLYPFA